MGITSVSICITCFLEFQILLISRANVCLWTIRYSWVVIRYSLVGVVGRLSRVSRISMVSYGDEAHCDLLYDLQAANSNSVRRSGTAVQPW